MHEPAASNDGEHPEQPQRLTAAMAFGFAAGALLARKPAAALTALATGVLACAAASTRRKTSAASAPLIDPQPAPLAPDDQTPVPTAETACVSLGELEPMPELSDSAEASPTLVTDDLLTLSLPDLDAQSVAAEVPPSSQDSVAPDDDDFTSPAPSRVIFAAADQRRRAISARTQKRSWLNWFR